MASPTRYGRAGRARNIRRRANHEQLRRRHQVSELLAVENLNQREIALRLGISQPTVSRDVKAIEREWRAENPGFVERWKKTLIQRCNREHRLALEAFQRSLGDKEVKRQEQEMGPVLENGQTVIRPTGKTRAVVERTAQAGDAKFLAEMHKRNLEIGKIVGAYPAKAMTFGGGAEDDAVGDEPGTVPDVLVIRVGRRAP